MRTTSVSAFSAIASWLGVTRLRDRALPGIAFGISLLLFITAFSELSLQRVENLGPESEQGRGIAGRPSFRGPDKGPVAPVFGLREGPKAMKRPPVELIPDTQAADRPVISSIRLQDYRWTAPQAAYEPRGDIVWEMSVPGQPRLALLAPMTSQKRNTPRWESGPYLGSHVEGPFLESYAACPDPQLLAKGETARQGRALERTGKPIVGQPGTDETFPIWEPADERATVSAIVGQANVAFGVYLQQVEEKRFEAAAQALDELGRHLRRLSERTGALAAPGTDGPRPDNAEPVVD